MTFDMHNWHLMGGERRNEVQPKKSKKEEVEAEVDNDSEPSPKTEKSRAASIYQQGWDANGSPVD